MHLFPISRIIGIIIVCAACTMPAVYPMPATADEIAAGEVAKAEDRQDEPDISAQAAILLDSVSGVVIWERQAGQRMYPASLTKMLTALTAARHAHPDDTVTVSREAARTGESSMNLAEGETLTVRDLLLGVMLRSANDGSVALAEHVGGSVEGFAELMNREAKSIGAVNSHFVNPHGLHHDDHYTTARDLGRIAVAYMQNDELAAMAALQETVIPWPAKPWDRKLVNRNRLLTNWPLCDGVKTGYTRQAGRCLAASATDDGWRLIAVVLNCTNSWEDARTLLQWGFDTFMRAPVVSRESTVFEARVRNGVEPLTPAVPLHDAWVIVRRDEPLPQLQVDLAELEAPVQAGMRVGTVSFMQLGAVQSVDLAALADVERTVWARMWDIVPLRIAFFAGIILAAGVLVHGAGTKAVGTRRRRLAARKREDNLRRTSHSGRQNRLPGRPGRPRQPGNMRGRPYR